jgi:hypothetical protein
MKKNRMRQVKMFPLFVKHDVSNDCKTATGTGNSLDIATSKLVS